MAGKKKFAPRKLKSPKREVGVNAALLAGGGAAGTVIGAKIGGARGRAGLRSRLVDATRQAKFAYDTDMGVITSGKDKGWSRPEVNKADTAVSRLATKEAKRYNYKSQSYKGIVGSNADIKSGRYPNANAFARKNTRDAMRGAASSRGARRGAAVGGLSGVALTALAQAVAKELRKKR